MKLALISYNDLDEFEEEFLHTKIDLKSIQLNVPLKKNIRLEFDKDTKVKSIFRELYQEY